MSGRKFKPEISDEACKGCLICVYICRIKGAGILKESEKRTPIGGVLPEMAGDCT